jgi:hypothetical protein
MQDNRTTGATGDPSQGDQEHVAGAPTAAVVEESMFPRILRSALGQLRDRIDADLQQPRAVVVAVTSLKPHF